jgi:L-methionine (R)-S-oxide reductase
MQGEGVRSSRRCHVGLTGQAGLASYHGQGRRHAARQERFPVMAGTRMNKTRQYAPVLDRLRSLLEGETDEVAIMATIVSELHQGLDHFDWTGFYRVVAPGLLKIGPYQGGHGCLTIPFERGVCGKCAREAKTQMVPDVTLLPHHIACSASTRSEIVVPVIDAAGRVRAVLDVDSDTAAVFDEIDAHYLEEICRWLTCLGNHTPPPLDHETGPQTLSET